MRVRRPTENKRMNVWGMNARSWRKARKRAVSPIIATILLVAITVVLAAVLYVLISGLTHGPGNTPIGTAFAIGAPISGSCTAAQVTAKICATAGDQIWTFTIEQSTITLSSVQFEVKSPGGTALGNTLAASFAIQTITGTEVASYAIAAAAGLAMTASWSHFAGSNTGSTPITTTMSFVVDTGVTTANWTPGAGNTVIGLGVGSFSGTTSPVTLP
ncbi:MAG: type IV pilin [Thermoplasmata archaeon]|nr:type IV pilin [Thermoplasmata archaeon]